MSETSTLPATRRAEIETMLARYPHLPGDALAQLIHWFTKEASALDVGLIASNEEIATPYRAFRSEHIDPLRSRDWVKGAFFAVLVTAVLIALFWRGF